MNWNQTITSVKMAVLTKDGKQRFATVGNEEEFLAILQNKDSASTQRATEKCVNT